MFRGKRESLEDVSNAFLHEVGDIRVELKTDHASSRGIPEIEENGSEDREIVPESQKRCEKGDLISILRGRRRPYFVVWMPFELFLEDLVQDRFVLIGPRGKDWIGGDLFKSKVPEPSQPEGIVISELAPSRLDHPVVDIFRHLLLSLFQKFE